MNGAVGMGLRWKGAEEEMTLYDAGGMKTTSTKADSDDIGAVADVG